MGRDVGSVLCSAQAEVDGAIFISKGQLDGAEGVAGPAVDAHAIAEDLQGELPLVGGEVRLARHCGGFWWIKVGIIRDFDSSSGKAALLPY
jgi:hypothetical protein